MTIVSPNENQSAKYLGFVRLKLIPSLCHHVLADGANVIVVDGEVVLLPDVVDAVSGGLIRMECVS